MKGHARRLQAAPGIDWRERIYLLRGPILIASAILSAVIFLKVCGAICKAILG